MSITPKNSFKLPEFSGGLSEKFSLQLLKDNETPDCQNVYSISGALEKIKGYSKYNTTYIAPGAPKITGLFDYGKTDLSRYFIVVAGGKVYNANIDNAWVDISTTLMRTWITGGDLNVGRGYIAGAGTQLAGLSFGGYTGTDHTGATEEYDGTAWAMGGNLNVIRAYAAGAGTQTAGLAIGGSVGGATYMASTEEYNGTAWTMGGNLNVARALLAGAGTQVAGLSFGGDIGTPTNTTEEYDGTSWIIGGNLNDARAGLGGTGTQVAGLSFGGYSNVYSAITEEYDGTTWTLTGWLLNTARAYLAGAGTQVLALSFGGFFGIYTGATEEYNGTEWMVGGNLNVARAHLGGAGTLTAGLSFGGVNLGLPAPWLVTTEEYGQPSLSTTNLIDFSVMNNILILTDGQSPLVKWVGVGGTPCQLLSGNPPIGKYLEVYKNYLVLGNISGYSSRIQWSDLLNPENWNPVNWIDIDKDAGGYITGLETFYDELLVFKSNGIYKIACTGDPDIPFTVVKITDKVGAISNWSIVQVEGQVFFVAYDGFYVYNGTQPTKISDNIQSSFEGFNKTRLDKIYGIHFKKLNQVWWAVSTGTSTYNNMIYAYDYINTAWWKYTIDQAECFAERLVSNDVKVYSGGRSGRVYLQNDTNNFDGTAINAYWKSKHLDFGLSNKVKTLSELYAVVKNSGNWNVACEILPDFAPSGNVRGINVYHSNNAVTNLVRKLDLTERGRHFQIKLSQAELDSPFTINELTLNLKMEERE